MLRVGARNIKTAIAVLICLLIYLVIILICNVIYNNLTDSVEMATEIYTPFFACIATAYSMGKDKQKSLSQAKLRIIASIIGGLVGILVLTIYVYGFKLTWPFSYISATGHPTNNYSSSDITWNYILLFIPAIIITSLSCILVVWLCNILKQKESSFIAVLTLTAVMASLGTSPIIYGFNRILSTIIGVLVALGVNLAKLPRFKNKKLLFVVSMNGLYVEDNSTINGFHSYKVNQLINDGINLTYFTTRTPMGVISLTEGVNLNMPIICLSGAALYDTNKKEFIYHENLNQKVAKRIIELLKNINVIPFINSIYDNVLYTYHEKPTNEGEISYANARKNSANGSYMTSKLPDNLDICYFVIVEKNEKIPQIIKVLDESDIKNDIIHYEYDCYSISEEKTSKGYTYLKIYSKSIMNLHALDILRKDYKVVSCGTHKYDMLLFGHSDYTFTNNNSTDELRLIAKNVINSNNDEVIFKEIGKIYHKKEI